MNSSMTIEENFVTLCSCCRPDSSRVERIKTAASLPMNWEVVYDIAFKQRTFLLLYRNLAAICPDFVPETILNRLKSTSNRVIKRNLFLSAYLNKILNILTEHYIPALPFKGPSLETDLFGDIGLRYYSDLDLLIHPKDVTKAYAILIANGFKPELSLNETQLKKLIQNANDISFYNKNLEIYIELHWELTGNYISKPLLLADVPNNFEKVLILNNRVSTLPPELLLLYLCIHGAKHEWEYLELVCCIDAAIIKNNIDWKKLDILAKSWRAKRMLELGIYLSWRLFKTDIPSDIITKIENKNIVPQLAIHSISEMFGHNSHDKKQEHFTRSSRFHFDVRDMLSEKLRYLLKLLFRPAKIDWGFYRPPAALSFSLYLLRPFRLFLSLIGSRYKTE